MSIRLKVKIMNNNPKISIIVPVYKTEKYLDRCLESIVNQTYKNLEIILVDDASPDNCPQMCDDWAQKDSRIRAFHIENNGVANARNFALTNSSGEYVGFVDSDDYIEKNQFEILYQNMVEFDADISVCGYQINVEDEAESNIRVVSYCDTMKMVATGDYKYGVLWNKLYKKSLVADIKMPHFACCEDLVFNYYAFKKANKVVECDDKLYHYMQNDDSTVHGSFGIGAFDAVYSKEIILKEQQGTEIEKYAVRGLISSCFVVLSGVIQSGKFSDKYDYLRSIILSYKKDIFSSPMYSKTEKLKTLVLASSRMLYNTAVKRSKC